MIKYSDFIQQYLNSLEDIRFVDYKLRESPIYYDEDLVADYEPLSSVY
jgi:hypothetical protein